MSRYFEDVVLDRLCDAAVLAGNNNIILRVTGIGINVERSAPNQIWRKTVSFLDLSEAKFNILRHTVEEAMQQVLT